MYTLFYGGKIITMEDDDKRSAEAVLVEDGIIVGVGSLAELKKKAGNSVEERNLSGKCMLPGFIDTHSHITMNGQVASWADLSECNSFSEIIETMKNYIEYNKLDEKSPVIGYGYDHNFLEEKKHPDKNILDQISSTNPILILHISAHLACVNSKMLTLSGITELTEDPFGGVYGRVEGTNIPNGYLEEAAMSYVQKTLLSQVKFDALDIVNKMQEKYIEYGITTAQDGATDETGFSLLKMASDFGRLKLDVVAYPLLSSNGREIAHKNAEYVGKYQKGLKIGGYKVLLDGSPQGRSAWMSEPYMECADDYRGYPWMKDEELDSYVRQSIEDGMQLLAHCNGDAASEQFLDSYTRMVSACNKEMKLRPVMVHCQTVRADQLKRMKNINMIASIFVGHVYYWGEIHRRNFGEKRGNRISPVKEAMENGLSVNLHQDTPVTKPDMLHSIWCAVNRISRDGNVIGAEQSITVYEALKAVTINAAYAYFEENTKGSISEGKYADFVILDQNPLEINKELIKDIRVLETVKKGVTIYIAS
ncbi:amidohydrolase [Lachnospiraceae bacterium OttesenSCG-928-D06]|nr:amidohydrolase [Lachnospiraceae bacterium OttesenSCG-928-D06]